LARVETTHVDPSPGLYRPSVLHSAQCCRSRTGTRTRTVVSFSNISFHVSCKSLKSLHPIEVTNNVVCRQNQTALVVGARRRRWTSALDVGARRRRSSTLNSIPFGGALGTSGRNKCETNAQHIFWKRAYRVLSSVLVMMVCVFLRIKGSTMPVWAQHGTGRLRLPPPLQPDQPTH